MGRCAILNPTTLLGRELREVLDGHPELGTDVRLLSTEEDEIGTLTRVDGAATLVSRGLPDELSGIDVLFLCGGLSANRRFLDGVPSGVTVVLLALDATLAEGSPVVAGVNLELAEAGARILSPHPASVMLAHLLQPLRHLGPRRGVATVIQPVSLYGDPALDELLEQVRHTMAMAGRVSGGSFGGQLAFNLLPSRIGGEVVESQLAAIFHGAPPLAVDLLQGAVFHGLTASVWLELEAAKGPEEVAAALEESPWIERVEEPDRLGPIDAAGTDKVLLGEIRADASRGGGYWIRAVMDNLRLGGALNALEIANAVA